MAREPVIHGGGGSPAVHALVIGVGRYADTNIPGLQGAATSAIAFATWMLHHHAPPGFARGSIDVLASKPDGGAILWEGVTLDPPTLANVQAAVDALHARVDPHPEDMVVFYFCGHGIELGDARSLLVEDVDLTSTVDPFRNAIAFDDFVNGMASCGPRQQLFILDACREIPIGFGKWDDDVGLGAPLVRGNAKRRAQLGSRVHVVLDATSSTQKAWAGPDGGWFTEALLTVLDGPAGDNRFTPSPDQYSINTRDIADAMKFLVKGEFIDPPAGPQVPKRRGEGDIEFHQPARVIVPVVVSVRSAPPAPLEVAVEQESKVVASHTFADMRPWRSRLAVGEYLFRGAGPDAPTRIGVPARKVELP